MIALIVALIITYDPGGTVGAYLQAAKQSGVEIRGYCASACTAYLGSPGVCVSPDARLAFHQARNADGSKNLLATIMLQAQYPRRVVGWLDERGGLTAELVDMSGAEAIRLGVRACK